MKSVTHSSEMSRLEAFSDAVFALSATLLVVTLEIPDTISELTSDLKGFAAFGISFLALVLIWSVHVQTDGNRSAGGHYNMGWPGWNLGTPR